MRERHQFDRKLVRRARNKRALVRRVTILAGKLPVEQRKKARYIGLGLAMGGRLALLATISIIIELTEPIVNIFGEELSGRDFILLGGGLFLLAKSTFEIHEKLEGHVGHSAAQVPASFASVIIQILILDIVFSLDSVITAVGTADEVGVMMAAVIIAVGVMLVLANSISDFVDEHPTVKILALSFLLLIGMSLVAESFDQHIPKGYIYFAMAFSVFVELLNLRLRAKTAQPVQLHPGYVSPTGVTFTPEPDDVPAPRTKSST